MAQLRDIKKGIVFGGHWGFFGGSIQISEVPLDAAKREIYEEIGYKPSSIHAINSCEVSGLNIYSHSFYCSLNDISLSNLILNEGSDFGLLSIENIKTKKMFSKKFNKYFPVIQHPYIKETIEILFNKLSSNYLLK